MSSTLVARQTLLILGAGFSIPLGGPSLEGLLDPTYWPVSNVDDNELGVINRIYETYQAFKATDDHDYSIEDFFTDVVEVGRTGGQLFTAENESRPAKRILSELFTHFASVCGSIRADFRTPMGRAYRDLLAALWESSARLEVLTFNYDIVVEQLADNLGLKYDYGKSKAFAFNANWREYVRYRADIDLSILKLHGSSNWGVCTNCRGAPRSSDYLVVAFEKPFVPDRRKSCPFCGENYLSPGIVPPARGKPSEGPYLTPVWEQARERLRRAQRVVIIGYSLPLTDTMAVDALRETGSYAKRTTVALVSGKSAKAAYSSVFGLPTSLKFRDHESYLEPILEDIDGFIDSL